MAALVRKEKKSYKWQTIAVYTEITLDIFQKSIFFKGWFSALGSVSVTLKVTNLVTLKLIRLVTGWWGMNKHQYSQILEAFC